MSDLGPLLIRRALPKEAQTLTELLWRSKAHWGYDEAFMAITRATSGITSQQITEGTVFVGEADSRQLIGFYHLKRIEDGLHLDDLFVAPEYIGKGYGKRLFADAEAKARELGYCAFTFESDPNAEPFYLAQGAVRTGQQESSHIPGRFFPEMLYTFKDCIPTES